MLDVLIAIGMSLLLGALVDRAKNIFIYVSTYEKAHIDTSNSNL